MPAVPVPLPIRPGRTLPGAATCGHLGRAGEIRAVSLRQAFGSGKDCKCLGSTAHRSSQVTLRSGRRGGSVVRTDRGCARSRRKAEWWGRFPEESERQGPCSVPRSFLSGKPNLQSCFSGAFGARTRTASSALGLVGFAGRAAAQGRQKSARAGYPRSAQTSVSVDAGLVQISRTEVCANGSSRLRADIGPDRRPDRPVGSRFSLPIPRRRSRRWLATPTGGRAASRRCRWVRGGRRGHGRIRVRRRCWPRPAGSRPVSRRCARRR